MRFNFVLAIAVWCLIGAPALDAAEPPAAAPDPQPGEQPLTPQQRAARARELREPRPAPLIPPPIPSEEREARRREYRENLDMQMTELRQKATNSTLAPVEQRRLLHLEEVARRFDQAELQRQRFNSRTRAGTSTNSPVKPELPSKP
jgi:hypothetical protein